MSSVSLKEWPKSSYPKTLLSIISVIGGLAIFLLLASTLLVSQPIGSTVRGYFYGVTSSRNIDSEPSIKPFLDSEKSNFSISVDHGNEDASQHGGTKIAESDEGDGKETMIETDNKHETADSGQVEPENLKDKLPRNEVAQKEDTNNKLPLQDSVIDGNTSVSTSNIPTESTESVESSVDTTNMSRANDIVAGTLSSSEMFSYPL